MAKPSTRDRLLSAAVGVFAERGYRDATIAGVCQAADANIAAVNYHFGSKENLFRHVLREAIEQANEVHPIHGNLPEGALADRRLHAFMSALIHRNFEPGPAGELNRIMIHQGTREFAPDDVIQSEMARYEGKVLDSILVELLGSRSKEFLETAKMNVIGLCIFPALAHRLRARVFPKEPSARRLKRFVAGQHGFALAGISAIATPSA